ncbi:uncharacterized protein LOC108681694 [Hyalella azteca]|uniref:Uncharacterized protein LOC108681694 n=1 Tax=Hyalella azteca TaxID=294128 RepID=A0A8B7PJ89_HYAAZ|nr:uncharacterized protein LOC108681694 [Hyalella azteca]
MSFVDIIQQWQNLAGNGTWSAMEQESAGRSGYGEYGHSEVSYGGHGGYGGMSKYIDPFTLLAFGVFCTFLTYIYFYCIIKKDCIQFATCTTGGRKLLKDVTNEPKNETVAELSSQVTRLLAAAQATWALEED